MRQAAMKPKLFLGTLLLLSCFVPAIYAQTIADNSAAKAVIVIDPRADAPEQHAANELADFLGRVTAAQFEITHEPSPTRSNIFVGPQAAKSADATFSTAGLGTDGIVIRTHGNNLILAGGKPRGTLYAVYTFLEDYIGCHWWAPDATTIPHKPSLTIESINLRYVPPLKYRDILMPNALDPDWSVRNKRFGIAPAPQYRNAATPRGGYIDWWPTFHSFYIVLPPETYFDDHPEWYSLIDGKRTAEPTIHASLCLTNHKMREQFVTNLIAEQKRVPNITAASVGYPDDDGYPIRCQCDQCVAAETAASPSDLFVEFANFVAEEFEKVCPDTPVALGAYHHTMPAPRHVKPRHNILVRLCNISNSWSVPAYHDRNIDFREEFLRWIEVAPQISIYEYVVNFTYEMLPHPNLRSLGPDIRYYVDHGVSGIYAEGWNRGTGGYEMAELRAWLLARLMWNPYQSDEKLIAQFAQGYYGPAAEHIVAYLQTTHDAVDAGGDWLHLSSPPTARFLSFRTLNQSWRHLRDAEEAVQNNTELLRRVKIAQLPVLYTFMVRWAELRETALCRAIPWPLPNSISSVFDNFMAVIDENRIALSSRTMADLSKARQNQPLSNSDPDKTLAADLRGDPELMIFRPLWQSYQPVMDLPLQARFALDPQETGQSCNWHIQAFDDSAWQFIRVDEFWENQGHPQFDGTGWYRIRFTPPAAIGPDRQLFLSFGRMDQAGTIWLNDHHVADYPGPWDARFEIPVTDYLIPNRENLLTVKVFGGEGVGGLWAPIKLIMAK